VDIVGIDANEQLRRALHLHEARLESHREEGDRQPGVDDSGCGVDVRHDGINT
jgi:hypothetical protein